MKILIFLSITFLCINDLRAQEKVSGKGIVKQSVADSLFFEVSSTIYYSFYATHYTSAMVPTFTMFKVDIDKEGKVTSFGFSDSADSTFVKAYLNRKKWHDDKATLERYAKAKSYTDISLLIPVSWEPNYPNQKKVFSYDELEGIMKFHRKSFIGKSITYSPIYIKFAPDHNE